MEQRKGSGKPSGDRIMKYLIGFNIMAFAITLLIVMTIGYDMETKDKAMILVLMPVFVGLISIGAFLMTEG